MLVRTKLRIAAVALFSGALVAIPAVASAGTGHPPYVGTVKAGGTCTARQAHDHATGSHDGDRFECRRVSPGCYLWKFDGHPTGDWTGGPAHCPTCTPKHSHSPTPSPSASDSPAPSTSPTPTASPSDAPLPSGSTAGAPSTSAAGADLPGDTTGELPVTGPGLTAAISGAALLLSGAFLLWLTRRRREA